MGSDFLIQWVEKDLLDVPKSAIFSASHKTGTLKIMESMLNTYKIYFVRTVYDTVNCVLTACVRNDLERPTFRSDSIPTHALSTAVSSILFLIRFTF